MSRRSSPQSNVITKNSGLSISWRFLLKLAVSALLIWLLVRNRDFADIYRQVQAADPMAIAAAWAILLAVALPTALRWSRVLKALGVPAAVNKTLPAVLIGNFFNQGLPSTIGGDAFRAWEISAATGARLPLALSSVVIDRVAGFLALFILVTLMLPELFAIAPSRFAFAVLLLLIAGYAAVGALMMLDLFHKPLARFRLVRGLAQLSADMRCVLLSPARAIPVLAYGLVNNSASTLALYIIACGLGIPVSVAGCFAIAPLAALVAALPISVAGWGVREGAFVAGFGLLGIGGVEALILSVLFGLVSIVAALPGGFVWLTLGKSGRGRDWLDPARHASPR
jgi:uncharacterized protein (TIRG00374 family)